MIFRKDDKLIRFVHIPRTGGRSITKNIGTENQYKLIVPSSNFLHRGKEYHHLNSEEEKEFLKNVFHFDLSVLSTIPTFSVIRNPIDRFKSAYSRIVDHYRNTDSLEQLVRLDDKETFFHFMNDEIISTVLNGNDVFIRGFKNYPNNWFEKQRNFIEEHTKIWKFEDGLGEEFVCWIKQNFDLDFIPNLEYERCKYDNNLLKPSDKLLENAAEYYKEDFYGYC